jgi:hypothetical protein
MEEQHQIKANPYRTYQDTTQLPKDCASLQSSSKPHRSLSGTIERSSPTVVGSHQEHDIDDPQSAIGALAIRFVQSVDVSTATLLPPSVQIAGTYSRHIFFDSRAFACDDISDKLQLRFGEHSDEAAKIYGALIKFGRGEISKREALSVVSDTIGGHLDLKYELLETLKHSDSRWGPGDFDLPQLSSLHSAPSFLQPVHEPKMRLPSMSGLWDSKTAGPSPASPVTSSGLIVYNGHEISGNHEATSPPAEPELWQNPKHAVATSSAPSTTSRRASAAGLASPGDQHMIIPTISSDITRHQFTPLSFLYEGDLSRSGAKRWTENDDSNMWLDRRPEQLHEYESALADNHYSPTAREAVQSLSLPQTEGPNASTADDGHDIAQPICPHDRAHGPSLPGNPFAMPVGQPLESMPPPTRKRSRKSSGAGAEAETVRHGDDERHTVENGQRDASRGDTKPFQPRRYVSGLFIHGICGKGFTSRSKVKKHHWGGRMDDINTATGCWAKNKKPDIAWDDHPSCKEGPKHRFATQKRSTAIESKAPVVPSMVPSQNNPAPAFTTTGDFRKPVVEALDAPHEPSQFSQDGYLPYHSHQLPPRSPFDTLLTAVNLASDIEAPVPRGRNDSVVLQLDAQVLAAERAGQYLPAWAFPPHQYENSVEDEQRFHHSNVAYGQSFGTSPIYSRCAATQMRILCCAPQTSKI